MGRNVNEMERMVLLKAREGSVFTSDEQGQMLLGNEEEILTLVLAFIIDYE